MSVRRLEGIPGFSIDRVAAAAGDEGQLGDVRHHCDAVSPIEQEVRNVLIARGAQLLVAAHQDRLDRQVGVGADHLRRLLGGDPGLESVAEPVDDRRQEGTVVLYNNKTVPADREALERTAESA